MAAAQALRQADFEQQQLALHEGWTAPRPRRPIPASQPRLCAGCREKEARYGFREADRFDRPRTLCFECFRVELDRRRQVAERAARSWNAEQVGLPLQETLDELNLRRRRAQIAARHAIGA